MSQILHTAITLFVFFTILVSFHELGHFLAAKAFRMRVLEFAFGFGKRVLRLGFDGQTEYNVRALPLGGFVRIAGMEAEDHALDRATGGVETTNVSTMEQETRETDGADPDGFNSRPLFQRFVVILAGPVFSFLLGWMVLCLVGVTIGFPLFKIGAVTPASPAASAGIRPGDTILQIDAHDVDEGSAIDVINGSIGKPLAFTLRGANGMDRTLTVTPVADKEPDETVPVGRIGISGTEVGAAHRRDSLGVSVQRGSIMTANWFLMITSLIQSGAIKDNVGGPVQIAKVTNEATQSGPYYTILLLGQLSLSLGLFNLLPIPVLDGGHLVLMFVELIRRRKLTVEQTNLVTMSGLAFIGLLMVLILTKDVTGLFRHEPKHPTPTPPAHMSPVTPASPAPPASPADSTQTPPPPSAPHK